MPRGLVLTLVLALAVVFLLCMKMMTRDVRPLSEGVEESSRQESLDPRALDAFEPSQRRRLSATERELPESHVQGAAEMTVIVTGPSGLPVVDAKVKVRASQHSRQRPGPSQTRVSGRDGKARFSLTGHLALWVEAVGYERHSEVVVVGAEERLVVEVALSRGTTIGGFVYDERGHAVTGAIVTASQVIQDQAVTTDETGRYDFGGFWSGFVSLTATKRLVGETIKTVEVGDHEVIETNLTIIEGASLLVRVVDPSGEPITKGNAKLVVLEGASQLFDGRSKPLDDEGRVWFPRCWSGDYLLSIEAHLPDRSTTTATRITIASSRLELEVVVGQLRRVTGRLVSADGEPLADVTLYASTRPNALPSNATTDRDGIFSFVIAHGTYFLEARIAGSFAESHPLGLVDVAEGVEHLGDFVLPRGGEVVFRSEGLEGRVDLYRTTRSSPTLIRSAPFGEVRVSPSHEERARLPEGTYFALFDPAVRTTGRTSFSVREGDTTEVLMLPSDGVACGIGLSPREAFLVGRSIDVDIIDLDGRVVYRETLVVAKPGDWFHASPTLNEGDYQLAARWAGGQYVSPLRVSATEGVRPNRLLLHD